MARDDKLDRNNTLGDGLDALFAPASIAIIGASQDETKIGGRPVQFLRKYGFSGGVYPVNPKAAVVQGYTAYPSIAALPQAPDLAVIAVAAELAPQAVADCAARGVKAAVILSSGFGEMGEVGEQLQKQLAATARASSLRLLGPNCLGSISFAEKAIATFSIVIENALPRAGPLGIISQSGNLGSYTMLLAAERGVGISRFITTGNECDIDVADAVAWMARDPSTEVILLILETCRNAQRFIAALEIARASGKPVVVLKIGASDAGQAAAASHTGALAGSDAVFDAVLKRAGALRVHAMEQLIDVGHAAIVVGKARLPKGNRVAIVTASGGFGVLLADAATGAGLTIPAMSEATQKRILKAVPYAAPRNPIDATAQMSSRPELLEEILSAVVEDAASDAVLFMMSSALFVPRLKAVYVRALMNLRHRYPNRLILLCTHGPQDALPPLNDMGFPTVDGVDAACRTIAALVAMGKLSLGSVSKIAAAKAEPLSAQAFRNEFAAKHALATAGLPILAERLVSSPELAAKAAEAIGFPVVVKIISPDIPHKSEVGGVLVGLATAEDVRLQAGAMLQRVKERAPHATIDGLLVAPMVKGGIELILGASRDPIFGPSVMVGFGGIFAELLKDVAVRPAPVDEAEALEMLISLKGFAVLDGARGRPKADVAAAAKAIAALSRFAAAHADDVAEIDINPLIVRDVGHGVVALDALLVPVSQRNGKAQ